MLTRRTALTTATGGLAGGLLVGPPAHAAPGELPRSLVGLRSDGGAEVVAAAYSAPHQVDLVINSPALGHTAAVRVLLPRGFRWGGGRAWPVLYALHGGYGSFTDWSRKSKIQDLARRHGALVVMPDGGQLGFYSDWRNGGRSNKPGWETFHIEELPQVLEVGFAASDVRAVVGLSMGGFGAVSYAGRHPGFFRAAASLSGTLDTLHPHTRPLTRDAFATWLFESALAPAGYDGRDLFGDPTKQRRVWELHNPSDLVPALAGTTLLVSCGDGRLGPLDDSSTDPMSQGVRYEAAQRSQNEEFVRRAERAGLPVRVHFYRGSHSWPYWARELERFYPALMRAIDA